ncbi:histidine phosphatase family protein [Phyllobacterium myrsinacearum]|uniref:Putative phosphoglycerate mutase n=1 Tax=Phyllobacterium myrsinacearum TaxID=28101 RepID=A0A839EDW4_9HYPH|nr:histidine phosphatase family protein [Phyllobacterium myrsinacearum]MBA8876929.1 putative phosphoglycerate mutase [Phyllobacterium myrsinacearum]
MKNLFVVTHTESVHHTEGLVGGWYDSALTPKGQHDAGLIAKRLKVFVGDAPVELFSSDLIRASQTADFVSRTFAVKTVLTPELREMSYGIAEGKPQAWLHQRNISAPADNRLDHRGGLDGAETKREFATRIYQAMDMIVGRPCETQIIVTHGFALTFVVAAWIKMPIDAVGYMDLRVQSGSITHLREDEYWQSRTVMMLGDISHFG